MEVSIISQGTVSGTPPGFFRFSHLVLCLLFLCVYVDTSVIFVKKSSELNGLNTLKVFALLNLSKVCKMLI